MDERVSIYSIDCEHANHKNSSYGLDETTKDAISEIFETGVEKPNAIIAALKRKNVLEPSKSQLVSFLKQLRKKKYDASTLLGHDLRIWCEEKNICTDLNDKD